MSRTRKGDGRTDGRTDGRKDGRTDGRTDGQGGDYMLPRNFFGEHKNVLKRRICHVNKESNLHIANDIKNLRKLLKIGLNMQK
jgi:hypothetical protein